MKESFKQSAKDFIEKQSLNDDELTQLEAILKKGHVIRRANVEKQTSNGESQGCEVSILSKLSKYIVSFGVSAALIVMFFVLPSINETENKSNQSLVLDIANEVAKNHIKMKPLEVKTKNIIQLRTYFTELDFSVVYSEKLTDLKSKMLGARYCSIQGVTAAQIRYQKDSVNKLTLYEVPYDSKTFGDLPNINENEMPIKIFARGLSVTIWVENGLLMATVEEIPPQSQDL